MMTRRLPPALVVLAIVHSSAAGAGEAAYRACCDGAECPAVLQVIGPGTRVEGAAASAIALGPWELACAAGAFHAPSARVPAPGSSAPGAVLTPLSARAAACFDAACRLPPDLCVQHRGDSAFAVQCGTGAVAADPVWRAPAGEDTVPVVIAGKVLKARSPAAPPVATPIPSPPAPAVTSPVVLADPASLDVRLPAAPPDPCVPNMAMRDPSNQQVDEGNEALVAGAVATALDKYRAAITIHGCNAFAWAALGDTLLAAGRPAEARQALEVATRLMPSHFQAWTNLGRAAEDAGDTATARAAYERALSVRPDHLPARRGVERLP